MGGARRLLRVGPPVECFIVERVNRFVVRVIVDGEPRLAYINNTGRLFELLVKGRRGFCLERESGKTDYKLFAVEERGLGAVVDTQLQMEAFERAVERRFISWLAGCRILRRNARLGDSLIDYLLDCGGSHVYLEVKSAVLREGRYAMYPDSPSERGRKHVKALIDNVRAGGRSCILFIAALPEVDSFRPNASADPELRKLLLEALQLGVDVRAIGMYYNPEDSSVYLYDENLRVEV